MHIEIYTKGKDAPAVYDLLLTTDGGCFERERTDDGAVFQIVLEEPLSRKHVPELKRVMRQTGFRAIYIFARIDSQPYTSQTYRAVPITVQILEGGG